MASYTQEDYKNAIAYAKEKLRQETIHNLKLEEPLSFSFIDVKDIGIEGWRTHLNIPIESSQEQNHLLSTYRQITFNSELLDCSRFSCINLDLLKRPITIESDGTSKEQLTACNFSETTSVSLPIYDTDANVIKKFTACGPGCYTFNKKRNPHTGIPEASGVLLSEAKNENGENVCKYLNQRLILWGAVPYSRVNSDKKIVEGYNSNHVPPLAFEDDENFNRLSVTSEYCAFFKRYLDKKSGECYRTGWLKFVHFMFGTYFTNLVYEVANPKPGDLVLSPLNMLIPNPLAWTRAGVKPTNQGLPAFNEIGKVSTIMNYESSYSEKDPEAEKLSRRIFGKYLMKDEVSSARSLIDYFSSFKNNFFFPKNILPITMVLRLTRRLIDE